MLSGMRLRHFVSEMVTVRIIGKTALVTLCPCVASIKRLSFYSNKYMVIFIGYCMCTFSLIDYHSFIDSLTSIKLSRGWEGESDFCTVCSMRISISINIIQSISISFWFSSSLLQETFTSGACGQLHHFHRIFVRLLVSFLLLLSAFCLPSTHLTARLPCFSLISSLQQHFISNRRLAVTFSFIR